MCVHHGQNSGYQAVGLAYHLKADRIILIGFDMQRTGGKSHWHGDHPRGLNNADAVHKWPRHFPALAADLHWIVAPQYRSSFAISSQTNYR